MSIGLYVKRYFCPILTKIWIYRHRSTKIPNTKFHENPSCVSLHGCRRADVAVLFVGFCNCFANAVKKKKLYIESSHSYPVSSPSLFTCLDVFFSTWRRITHRTISSPLTSNQAVYSINTEGYFLVHLTLQWSCHIQVMLLINTRDIKHNTGVQVWVYCSSIIHQTRWLG